MRLKIQGSFLCPVCYASFENSDILTTHFANVHDNPNDSVTNSNPNQKNEATPFSFNTKIESVSLIFSLETNLNWFDLLFCFKILKKYGPNSDNDSIHETKSISSANENYFGATNKEKFDNELQVWKEQLQLSEDTRLSRMQLMQYT